MPSDIYSDCGTNFVGAKKSSNICFACIIITLKYLVFWLIKESAGTWIRQLPLITEGYESPGEERKAPPQPDSRNSSYYDWWILDSALHGGISPQFTPNVCSVARSWWPQSPYTRSFFDFSTNDSPSWTGSPAFANQPTVQVAEEWSHLPALPDALE